MADSSDDEAVAEQAPVDEEAPVDEPETLGAADGPEDDEPVTHEEPATQDSAADEFAEEPAADEADDEPANEEERARLERRALHANIFGEDDSSDDDGPELQPQPTAQRVQEALKSAAAPKAKGKGKAPKAKPAKADKADKRKGAASSSDKGDKKRKRLQKRAASDAASLEEGVSADDPEGGSAEPFIEGEGEDGGEEEAEDENELAHMEDNSAEGGGHIDGIIQGMKRRRGKIVHSRDALVVEVQDLMQRMDTAKAADDGACKADPPQPAVHKVAMLNAVKDGLRKRHLHEVMMDHGMLSTLAAWLSPMPDGSLVSLQVRTAVLESLLLFDVDETVLGSLRSSGIGKYVKLLSLHSRETHQNKKVALMLIEKWTRPIHQSSVSYSATEVQMVQPKHTAAELADGTLLRADGSSAQDEPEGQGRVTGNKAFVPRPIGMDFRVQPASTAIATASTKFGKDTSKGKLVDKIVGVGRKKNSSKGSQAMTMSVEGRTLDRF